MSWSKKPLKKMCIQWIRHIIQGLSFLFFVVFVVGSVCSFSIGEIRFVEPVGGLQVIFANLQLRTLLYVFSGVGTIVLIIILLGGVWCAWACPVGSIVELAEYVFQKAKIKPYTNERRHKRNNRLINKNVKHSIFGGILVSAVASRNTVWCNLCPIGTICRTSGIGPFAMVAETVILGGVITSSLYEKRFFCKYICPISSFISAVSKLNIFVKPFVDKDKCKKCKLCENICPQNIPLHESKGLNECTKCLECYSNCPNEAISIKLTLQ